MFLSTPVKVFCGICFVASIFSGCNFWRGNENSQVTFAAPSKAEFPFTVREPEVFQADLLIRAGDVERRMFIARDHDKRRADYDVGSEDHRALIMTDKLYVIDFKRSSYGERAVTSDLASIYEPLTSSLLSARDYAELDEIGRNGSLVEYRAKINGSTVSETSIVFDESIGLPIRHDVYSLNDGERKLEYSAELQNFRTVLDEGMFEIPKGFKKVTSSR